MDGVALALLGAALVPPVALAEGHRQVGLLGAAPDLVVDGVPELGVRRQHGVGPVVLGLEVGEHGRVARRGARRTGPRRRRRAERDVRSGGGAGGLRRESRAIGYRGRSGSSGTAGDPRARWRRGAPWDRWWRAVTKRRDEAPHAPRPADRVPHRRRTVANVGVYRPLVNSEAGWRPPGDA